MMDFLKRLFHVKPAQPPAHVCRFNPIPGIVTTPHVEQYKMGYRLLTNCPPLKMKVCVCGKMEFYSLGVLSELHKRIEEDMRRERDSAINAQARKAD